MSLVYEEQEIDTHAGDAPLQWSYEERLTKAAQWAAAPGEKLSLAYLEGFYNVPAAEIQARAKIITPFKKEVVNIAPGPDYADNKPEEKEGEETLGEWDDDGEWKEPDEESPADGLNTIEDPNDLAALFKL